MEPSGNYKYGIKSTFSQCLALTGASFLQIGIGVELICPTIIIGALASNHLNEKDPLTMTKEQESWFGSLVYLFTPLGSLLSSLVLRRLGHKNCMIITNVPYLVSQITLFYADNVTTLYVCSILMGLNVGFSGGPFAAYLGEVCEPKLRGAMMSATNVFYFFGYLLFTIVFALTKDWRRTVLINMAVPVITTVILIASPDSPIWLLANGKVDKAQRTLGKLRGWVSYEKCSHEFQEMIMFTSSNINTSSNEKHNNNDLGNSWTELFRPSVLKPFFLLSMYFFFANVVSGAPYAPYLVEVFNRFCENQIHLDAEWTITFSVVLSMIGGTLNVFLMSTLGKRRLTFWTLTICSFSYIAIGIIGVYLKPNQITTWAVLIFYLTATFVSAMGVTPISWTLLSEIFPLKSRNITVSICSTLPFIFSFFMTKYYPNFEALVTFYNTFTILGVGGLIGCIYFYKNLPETENKTLQEITEFFK